LVDGLGAFIGPDLYDLSGGGKLILMGGVVDVAQNKFAHVFCEWLHGFLLFAQAEISVDVLIVLLGVEHAFEVVEIDGFVGGRGEETLAVLGKGHSFDGLRVVVEGDQ
jgi:hypothetical protein